MDILNEILKGVIIQFAIESMKEVCNYGKVFIQAIETEQLFASDFQEFLGLCISLNIDLLNFIEVPIKVEYFIRRETK